MATPCLLRETQRARRGQGTMRSEGYRRGALAGGLVVRTAIALTLFFVIVFPGLAVVGLAALRLALLACAKNTKAVSPQAGDSRPCSALARSPLRHTLLYSCSGPCGRGRWQQMAVEEICQHPRGPVLRPHVCVQLRSL